MMTLKQIRESKGVTKKAVYEYLGISQRTYDYYESNPQRMRIKTAKQIAEFLGVPVTEIFFVSDSK